MDKKLTDSEIVKALNTALGMEHISIYCANIKNEVRTIKVLDIIDLINRLQEENERLRENLDEIWEIKCRETDRNLEYIDEICNLKTENEGLKGVNENHKNMISMLNKPFDQIKAEAYKECIEKAKENCEVCEVDGELKVVITETNLNNLLKELVGDK